MGFEQAWEEENFRLGSGVGHSEDIALSPPPPPPPPREKSATFPETLSATGRRKSRLLGNPSRPCTSYMPIILSKKNTGISPRLSAICLARAKPRKASTFAQTYTYTHYLYNTYPICDFSLLASRTIKLTDWNYDWSIKFPRVTDVKVNKTIEQLCSGNNFSTCFYLYIFYEKLKLNR